ncbi:MucBP domain-containing protein [Lactobacillus crispatus]|uniref:MucBP domain-containing protein n=1 Tax=Lactobacillus crispatus TaxID=47770 RepID=UPI0030FD10E9
MARIFKSSSDKVLKAGMVVLGAGAVLASQAVQQDNASVAHAAKRSKGASHHTTHTASHTASHTSHTASHTSHTASHTSGGSKRSSHTSDVNQMHHAYSEYHKTHDSHHRGGAHQVDTNRHGKVTSTTDRHTDANGNTVSTITNHNHARTLRNGTNKETWISKYSNGATSHNDNWDGKHPGQSGFTDANGKTYTFKNARANQTKTDSAGNIWTYDPIAGHWQQTIEPKHLNNTPAPSDNTPSYTPSNDTWNPTPEPQPSGDNGTPTTPTPAPEKPVQTGTPAPQKPAETPKTVDKKTQNGTQTFNFVDKATNKTVGTSKVNGEVGKDVPVSLKVPNGYKLVAGQTIPTSANIKDKDNPINILVEKDANPDRKDGTQTIRFIDKATGNPVSKSTVGGKVGDNIAVDPKVPDGYHLVPGQKLPKNVDIKDTDTPIDILVEKDANKKPAQQTYQFVDQNGNKVVGTAVVKGNEGDHVSVSLKVPKGYHLVPGQKLPTVADLKATDKPIKILVAKDGTDGNGNADSGINGKNGKVNKGNGAGNKAGNTGAGNGNGGNGVASLPQTGNSKSNAGILAGSALVATMASLGIAYNKKKRNA